MEPFIRIGNRKIGPGNPVYIIAEMSANHLGDFNKAIEILHAAKEAGADAVKLQTFTADTHTLDLKTPCFEVGGGTLWDGRYLYDLYRECSMPWEWQPKLKDIADDIGIDLFSAAVDPSGVEFLETMNVPAYKVTSFEIVDLHLIRCMAKTKKPIIISTGMASLSEIDDAVTAARDAGAKEIALLKCTSAYPAPCDEMNLRTIPHLSRLFNAPAGLSDHSMGLSAPVTAVTLGASIIEKHFTLSRNEPGPDSSFSMEPSEFTAMVQAIRETEKIIGEVRYTITDHERSSRKFRRSLFAVADIKKGDAFTETNIRSIRPADGLPPKYRDIILTKKASKAIAKGTPLSWDLVS
ncbi:MAG: pseudaminic acid synthase [Deltaproteobacteria bacterium]|nr:pseudaminic acid synthase [Deltaproteobacteria bacterium]